jgi:hypothetical protein
MVQGEAKQSLPLKRTAHNDRVRNSEGMTFFRKLRIFALLFGALALALGFWALSAPGSADAPGCCWILYCTMEPPITCWEECRPCPKLSLPPRP